MYPVKRRLFAVVRMLQGELDRGAAIACKTWHVRIVIKIEILRRSEAYSFDERHDFLIDLNTFSLLSNCGLCKLRGEFLP